MTAEDRGDALVVYRALSRLARGRGDDFQLVLRRFALERLLYRVGQSSHRNTLVLKGAMLFQAWADRPHRPTRDIDFLGYGPTSVARFETIFRDLCGVPTASAEDGLQFLPDTVSGAIMKEGEDYEGIRLRFEARLATARIPVRVDVGFGDVVTPAVIDLRYPTLLPMPAPEVRAYPMPTVVAEKLEAMVKLGAINSRMKDFFDIWILAQTFVFDGSELSRAIQATFTRRGTSLPSEAPLALTAAFAEDDAKQRLWQAFLRRDRLTEAAPEFTALVADLANFLLPVLEALRLGKLLPTHWPAGGPWRPSDG